jgi:ABC-type antimicrobial peptide transport system permease subunit
MAQKRLSEIAIRKEVGGQRRQLISQFLTENFVLCFVATILGGLLGTYALLPGINALFPGTPYTINLLQSPAILLFLVILFIALSLVSGAYPAFYISSFKPVVILKGKQNLSRKNWLSRLFLGSQFFLTFIAIVSGFLFTGINEFQEKQDWGYQTDNLLVVPVQNQEQFSAMQKLASQSPRMLASAGSRSLVGLSSGEVAVKLPEKKYTVRDFNVSPEYLNTLGFSISEGRTFDTGLSSDQENAVIVNQEFVRQILGTESALNSIVEIGGESYNIVGVVRDFHFDDFFNVISPAIFRVSPEETYNYITLKMVGGGLKETEEIVKHEWAQSFPDTPYAGFFQEEVFDNFFSSTGSLKQVMNFVAMVAIILSVMGLFGLVSLTILKKMKEYSIRKILGARGGHMVYLISRSFVILMLISLVLAIPLSYSGFSTLFQQIFPGSLDTVGVAPFLLSTGIMLLVIFVTISTHIIQVLRTNPAKSLRIE